MANRLNVQNIYASDADTTAALTISSTDGISAPGLVGMIAAFAMSTAPTGWLVCNGGEYAIADYGDLYAAISTTWGSLTNGSGGAGSTHFVVPDLRGEFLRGFDGGRGVDSARTFASFQEGSHHVINTGGDIFGIESGGQRGDVPVTSSISVRYNSGASSAALSSADGRFGMARPRNIAIQYCIKF